MTISSERYCLILSRYTCHTEPIMKELNKGYYQHEMKVLYMDTEWPDIERLFEKIPGVPAIFDTKSHDCILTGMTDCTAFIRERYPPLFNMKSCGKH